MNNDVNTTSSREDLQALESKILDVERKLNRQLSSGETEARQNVAAWLRSAKDVVKKTRKVKCFARCFSNESMRDLKKLLEASEFPHQLVEFRPKHERAPTIAESESGNTFDRKVEEIWKSLQNERVTKIGVYGMSGIGKTTALARIRERVSKRRDLFDVVIWVDVSSDSSVASLQDKIAGQLNFSFLSDRDSQRVSGESRRAAMLRARIVAQRRFVLILDDVWNVHTLLDVGIPDPTAENGCKIVLTTRSLGVCNAMGTDKEIMIEPWPENEALELFKESVGYRVRDRLSYDPTLASFLEQIVRECAGLPLAIDPTAKGLKDTIDHSDWEAALEDLRDLSHVSEPVKKLVQILKLSFDRLNNEGLKKCLLYCALFPEDHEIMIEFLVEHLIVEGIVERKRTRELETETGREMVKQLQEVSLLNGSISHVGGKYVKMHDLIRDMALQIADESYQVKAGLKWESIPDNDRWNDDLSKVSLVNIRSAALSSEPPKTPRISTLFLYQSNQLDYISDEFFRHMKGLSVLNLSFTAIVKLPESVSDLVSLTALFLRNCSGLRYVPSLAKLKKLTMLDFSGSGIRFVPEGLDVLPLLRYLNFNGCPLFIMPRRVLRKLVNLQYLALPRPHKGPNAKAEDLKLFAKLESFEGVLYDVNSFNSYVETFERKRLNNYVLQVGSSDSYAHYAYDENHKKIVYLTGKLQGLASECLFLIPRDVNAVVVHRCHNNTGILHDFTHVSDTSELRVCRVEDSSGIEHLFSVSENKFPLLPKLETLNIDGVNNLCGLIKTEQAFSLRSTSFFSLKEMSIYNCNNVKTLFSFEVASFPNLEQLTLSRCEQLEAISTNHSNNYTAMPCLRRFILLKLPKLRKIPVIADSLQEIHIDECPELRKIDPLLDSEHCSISLMHVYIDRGTWGLLEWEYDSAKDFVKSRMNLANDSDMEEEEPVALAASAMSPASLEEEEAAALFRRSLDVIAALFQWDFRNIDEVIKLFNRNFQDGEKAPTLFQKDFDEIAASLFRRNLEDEEKEEVASFYLDLELLLVAFREDGIHVSASLRRRFQVEACIGRNLEVTSLFWSKSGSEGLTRRDCSQAIVGSALLRREKGSVTLLGEGSEVVASYARNIAARPLCSNMTTAVSATLFRVKLDDVFRWLEERNAPPLAYLLFIPRTGYYESGYRQH